jgi:serine/threonine-protein kinase
MIGSSGTHRIVATPAEGALWTAVQNLVAAEADLCGELGVSDDGQRTVYVASRRDAELALRLVIVDRVADSNRATALDSYEVAYYDTLDESVPARDMLCRQCAHRLPTWSAVCSHCRRSTALTAVPRGAWSRANAQPAVTAVLGPDCTPVGELPTAAGSIVAFMRDDSTSEIVVLAFERIEGREGATRAVPVGRLRRPSAAATHRPSSPHSGEVGPLRPDPMAPAPAVDLTGRVLGGKFRVQRLLGEGGMGRVYLAEHVRIRRRSALKVLSPSLVGDPESIKRFDAEARNASRIAHPNVAAVYDFEETLDGLVYIVLEYIDGETLGAVIAREIWLDIPRAVRIARDTAAALQAAHDLGIVHRDLKPDNIMLTRTAAGEDFVKVVDFGISKAAEEAGSNSRVTRTGFVIGTPQYMSPEQLAGEAVDARSDVYALGCVLYEAITGRRTFASATTAKPNRRNRRAREGVPRALDAIIKRALSTEPEDRYHTAQEMQDALDHLLGALERKQRRSRHRITIRIGLGVVAAAAIGGAWIFLAQPGRLARDHEVAAVPLVAATPAPAPATPAAVTPPKPPPIRPTPAHAATDVPSYLASVATVVRTASREALQDAKPQGSEHATFALLIGADGRVRHVTPVELSNVAAYDDALGAAVQNIATFGPPPAALIAGHDAVALNVVFQGSSVAVRVADPAATTPDR